MQCKLNIPPNVDNKIVDTLFSLSSKFELLSKKRFKIGGGLDSNVIFVLFNFKILKSFSSSPIKVSTNFNDSILLKFIKIITNK